MANKNLGSSAEAWLQIFRYRIFWFYSCLICHEIESLFSAFYHWNLSTICFSIKLPKRLLDKCIPSGLIWLRMSAAYTNCAVDCISPDLALLHAKWKRHSIPIQTSLEICMFVHYSKSLLSYFKPLFFSVHKILWSLCHVVTGIVLRC